MARAPTYIPLPPPPVWHDFQDSAASPAQRFFTPPSSPTPSPNIFYTPPTSPFHDALPFSSTSLVLPVTESPTPVPQPEDHFPLQTDVAIDLALDDEGLSTLEKIYLYSRSKASFHRIFIAHRLPEYLGQVSPQEAVEYVLPLLSGLAMDDEDSVKEALAAELIPVIWWFFTHCQIIPDDLSTEEKYASSSTTVTISVQAFTPILGTLLLSETDRIGAVARQAIVDFLTRMRKIDEREAGSVPHRNQHPNYIPQQWELDDDADDYDVPASTGLFGSQERALFTQEILQQIVVGMGRLDVEADVDPDEGMQQAEQDEVTYARSPEEQTYAHSPQQQLQQHHYQQQHYQQQQRSPNDRTYEGDWSNPYFPPSSYEPQATGDIHPNANSSTSSSASASPAAESAYAARRSPPTSRAVYSPGTDFPPTPAPGVQSPSASSSSSSQYVSHEPPSPSASSRDPSSTISNAPTSPANSNMDWDEYDLDQGTLGRVACMSLVAAVTAGGPLDATTLETFIQEAERVVHDQSVKVRKAASFALGALAKVVPEKLVPGLLPLFDSLRWDAYWDVRHSALFALPAILGRLSPAQRRTVALETVVALSADQHPTVRCGVLESLGEVLHSFIDDSGGPPEELVHLFLGRKEDKRVRDGQQFILGSPMSLTMTNSTASSSSASSQTPLESFYVHPKRPLICAFNFPAVALTLGGSRWGELRQAYLDLTENEEPDVLRTLAASLGELAKIIGPENARRDLVGVWWRLLKADRLVRPKVVESLEEFIRTVGSEVGVKLVEGVVKAWKEDLFKGWREREEIQRNMVGWFKLLGSGSFGLFRELLVRGLEDGAATVREAAVGAIPELWTLCSSDKKVLDDLSAGIRQLATSPISRRRMTFIACQQTLVLSHGKDGQPLIPIDETSLRAVADMANDDVEGVRIGVARFAALLYRNMLRRSGNVPPTLLELVRRLSKDTSREVQAYVAEMSITDSANRCDTPPLESQRARDRLAQAALFSRPPFPPRLPSTPDHESVEGSESGVEDEASSFDHEPASTGSQLGSTSSNSYLNANSLPLGSVVATSSSPGGSSVQQTTAVVNALFSPAPSYSNSFPNATKGPSAAAVNERVTVPG